jgi:hypothetical protein
MIVAKKFTTESEMRQWLASKDGIESVKSMYPPPTYTAKLNLIEKQVEVYTKVELYSND